MSLTRRRPGLVTAALSSVAIACSIVSVESIRAGGGTVRPGERPGTNLSGAASLRVQVEEARSRHPVAEALVQIRSMESVAEPGLLATDSLGYAEFSNLTPGRYQVLVDPPAPYLKTRPSTAELSPNRTSYLRIQVDR